ncbi:MAG: hypothetical protein CMJ46_08370 [Planctomyces sp.]|nr:hypothetical protein [Planctomyces sp.]
MSETDLNPSELWSALRGSIEDRDLPRLAFLCEKYEETIRENFPAWRDVPAEVRQDRIQRDAYAQSLIALAHVFDRAGKPELLELLQQEEPGNPVERLEAELEQAKDFINNRDYENAVALLVSMLQQYENWLGPQVQEARARVEGLLGVTLARAGDLPRAILHTRTALALCEELDDQEGIEIYTDSLKKMENLLDEG